MLVILDCDGVLVDSEPLSARALSDALTAHGLPMTPEETNQAFLGRAWPSVEELVRERFGAVPDGLQADYRARMAAAFERDLRPVPGVAEALDALPHPTCVASSGPHEKMRLSLGLCGLWDRLEGRIFSAWDVQRGKPAPDLFLHAAAAMGAVPADCVVVEDSPVGVQAARAAGMRVLGFAAPGGTPAGRLADADAVFSAMTELPALIEGLAAVSPGFAPRSA